MDRNSLTPIRTVTGIAMLGAVGLIFLGSDEGVVGNMRAIIAALGGALLLLALPTLIDLGSETARLFSDDADGEAKKTFVDYEADEAIERYKKERQKAAAARQDAEAVREAEPVVAAPAAVVAAVRAPEIERAMRFGRKSA
ncbi:hypothetical protein [Sphingomicrobium aestuariivivum]|uniref:hypothetical protein n=1 Tax=Sphingomicrobium aestuariivivum TaxID=1582356 RepID=UPI001FD655D6|nr:hypothetical protein [Sphingomicrobium aestuariivivum]MCJ8190573.1 hypothetical protein [Sphingomicrobium aestuariivivum]